MPVISQGHCAEFLTGKLGFVAQNLQINIKSIDVI